MIGVDLECAQIVEKRWKRVISWAANMLAA